VLLSSEDGVRGGLLLFLGMKNDDVSLWEFQLCGHVALPLSSEDEEPGGNYS
jgi:hypothetical protein